MSQAQLPNELATFLENWTTDPNNAKDAFVRFKDFLLTTPDVRFDFKARPGVSYSLRAANAKNDERPLFVLVDVVDDEPEARWLSVCFYADMVTHGGIIFLKVEAAGILPHEPGRDEVEIGRAHV